MNEPPNKADDETPKMKTPWGDIRRIGILIVILVWLVGFFYYYEKIDEKALYVLFGLIILYAMDLLFSIILSAKATELFKSFMFQTFIPVTALSFVAILSFKGAIDSSTTLSLFGLSLGYTTYVVGKRLKKESDDSKDV